MLPFSFEANDVYKGNTIPSEAFAINQALPPLDEFSEFPFWKMSFCH